MQLSGLSVRDVEHVQALIDGLSDAGEQEMDRVVTSAIHGDRGALYRFSAGAYRHPVTWWVGIFQIQMQMGQYGHRWRSVAATRASILWQITAPLRDEISDQSPDADTPILSAAARFNLRYRKADIAGRLTGGAFTNYASTGGRAGGRRLGWRMKFARNLTNFGIASYGAMIRAIAMGHRTLEDVLQALITGQPESLPGGFGRWEGALSTEEGNLISALRRAVDEATDMTQIRAAPVSIEVFCRRPENRDLRGLCR